MRRQNGACRITSSDLRKTDYPPEESSVEPSSATESSAEPDDQAPTEEVTLNVVYYTVDDKYEEDGKSASRPSNAAEPMIEAFENAHPDIKIEMNTCPSRWGENWLMEEIILGNTGDVILYESPIMNAEVRAMQDLTPYIENGDIDISAYSNIIESLKLYTKLLHYPYTSDDSYHYFLPTPGGDSVVMTCAEFGLNHEEAALEFIKFICGEEGAAVYEENGIHTYEENENIVAINEYLNSRGYNVNTGTEDTSDSNTSDS